MPVPPTFTPTSVPPTLTPTLPSPEPTHEPRTIRQGDFEITMITNPQDSSRTDVHVKNVETGEEKLYITLSDVHYHNSEYHNENLYIIRRIGYTPEEWDSEEWTDELWKYNADGKGTKLYSSQGLDFRVAPDERYIALCITDLKRTWEKLIFLDSPGNLAQEFTNDQLCGHDKKVHAPMPAYLSLLKWSGDGSEFWSNLSAGPSPQTIYRVKVASWQTTTYDVSELPVPCEYDLNTNTGKLVYSDLPPMYVADDAEEFAKSQQQVTLFVYDFDNQSIQTIATSVAKGFHPKWLDDNTIEYNNPDGDDRIVYIVK
jgi:hypothetical protein